MLFHSATENAIPNHKNLRTGRAKMKGKPLWNEEIGQASKHAKTAFHHWNTWTGLLIDLIYKFDIANIV
jgi:hypothetical protein